MTQPFIAFVATLLAAALAVPVHAASACRATSGPMTRPLLELYTSEGCDSCPPADRWLASNFGASVPDARAVALAFHVDYWDRLGWVDRFASAAYTDRQYAAMRANGESFVYTPQVLLQGHGLANWRNGTGAAADAATRRPAGATLALEADVDGSTVRVRVDAQVADARARADAQLLVAYADSGLVSNVDAGENRGVRLAHDNVVRALRVVGAPDRLGHVQATFSMSRPAEAGMHPMLVAFVQRSSTGDVMQALALPLAGCVSP
jgi:hypothetical protein